MTRSLEPRFFKPATDYNEHETEVFKFVTPRS